MSTSTDTGGLLGPTGADRRQWRTIYQADPVGYLTACRDRWGDVFCLEDGLVVVCDAESTRRVLVATNRESVPDPDRLNGNRLPTQEETRQWMRVRSLIGQALTPKAIRGHLPRLDQAVDAGLRTLTGQLFDPVAVGKETCLRAALPIYLTDPPPGLVPALLDAVKKGMALTEAAVALPRWWPSLLRRRLRRSHLRLHAELHALLTTQHSGDSPPPDHPTLLELLHSEPITADLVVRAVATALMAGIGTLGAAWCWLLHDLATQPDQVTRIRAEASTQTDLDADLPYTKAFVRESLRTHPPAWLLGRDTTTPVTITDNHTVPAGTAIMMSPYLIHHDARYWSDPNRFDPQRWLTPTSAHHRNAYLPFGAGPRVCLGTYLAQTLLTRTAAHIAAHYQLTVCTPNTARTAGTVLLPTGLTLRLNHLT